MKRLALHLLLPRLLFILSLSLSALTLAENEPEVNEAELNDSELNETVYIRDTLYVPLRNGQSSSHRILHQGIKSGTPLTRLQLNKESGYSQVRTKGGMTGWIQSQYLVLEKSATDRLAEANKTLAALRANSKKMEAKLSEQSNSQAAATKDMTALTKRNDELNKELEAIKNLAADVITIDQRNDQLSKDQDLLNQQIDDLMLSNGQLRDNSNKDWFLRGAGVIVLGLLLGFIVSRRLYRKASVGWS